MRIFFIGSYPEKPTTGGNLYHHKLIEAIKEMEYEVFPISVSRLPKFFRCRVTTFIYPFLIWVKQKPDLIIQVADYVLRYIPFSIFAQILGIPTIQLVHHFNEKMRSYDLVSKLNLVFIKFNLRRANGIIVNSQFTKERVIVYSGSTAKSKVEIINPGIEIRFNRMKKRVYKNKKSWNLLSVGSITERKGYHFLIDALKNSKDIPFKCYIVGNIANEKYYSLLVEKIRINCLEDRVIFLGYTSGERLQELYNNSDIFILPSVHEGYGIVVCEAICQGLPIIATNVGAIPEIIEDKKTGLLIKSKSPESIEKGIRQLITNSSLARELSENAMLKCASLQRWEETKEKFKKYITRRFNKRVKD